MIRVLKRVLIPVNSSGNSLGFLTCRLHVILPKQIRCVANGSSSDNRIDKSLRRKTFLRKLIMLRYMSFIEQYHKRIETKFPTMKIMRLFNSGFKNLFLDIKKFISVKKKQRQQGIEKLTREELELSFTLPKDLFKISPILLISTIPFTNYIVFPVIFFFPRMFLISHFWSDQQRLDFLQLEQKRRLKHNIAVFRCLEAEVPSIEQSSLNAKLKSILASLGSGTHPTVSDVLATKELFTGHPYSLNSLKDNHVKKLLCIHGMSQWKPFRRKRLFNRGILLKRMDNAIRNEGGVTKVPEGALKRVVSFRGLNPVDVPTEVMQEWLDQWLMVSSEVDETNLSLLLHCPILLAYNHSSNWALLYRKA